VKRHNSCLSYSNWFVGSNGGLNLSKTLGIVHLGHRGVGGSKSFGLDKTSLFSMGSGD